MPRFRDALGAIARVLSAPPEPRSIPAPPRPDLATLYRGHPERFPLGRPRCTPPVPLDPDKIPASLWEAAPGRAQFLADALAPRTLSDEAYAAAVESMLRANAQAFIEAGLVPPAYRVSWPRAASTRRRAPGAPPPPAAPSPGDARR